MMEEKRKKVELLLSLIRKVHGYLIIVEKDETGNKKVISQTPIDCEDDIEIEFVSTQYPLAFSEEDVQD